MWKKTEIEVDDTIIICASGLKILMQNVRMLKFGVSLRSELFNYLQIRAVIPNTVWLLLAQHFDFLNSI